MSATPTVTRFVISSNDDDVVTAKWPALVSSPFEGVIAADAFDHMRETVAYCVKFLRGSTPDKFIA